MLLVCEKIVDILWIYVSLCRKDIHTKGIDFHLYGGVYQGN